MFEAPLLDGRSGRGGWATLVSFALQALGLSLLIITPLLHTQALPRLRSMGELLAPPRGQAAEVRPRPPQGGRSAAREDRDDGLRAPDRIPTTIELGPDRERAAPPAESDLLGVPNGIPRQDNTRSLLDSIFKAPPVVTKAPPPPNAARPSSGVVEGLLISKVKPVYPPLAIRARVQGAMQLRALIGRDGRIRDLQLLSGHPWLAAAALDAVKQWRYRPYYLNGEAVEVETQITVNFTLAGGP